VLNGVTYALANITSVAIGRNQEENIKAVSAMVIFEILLFIGGILMRVYVSFAEAVSRRLHALDTHPGLLGCTVQRYGGCTQNSPPQGGSPDELLHATT
jgi:hypothetical protein